MALPDYQSCMLPLLGYLQEGQERSMGEITDHLASHFKLSAAECKEMLPSGSQAIFHNRVGWAKTYLKQAGLLETTRRGYSRITKAGIHLLQSKPETITVKTLDRYESFKSFRTRKRSKADQPDPASTDSQLTPAEELDAAQPRLSKELQQAAPKAILFLGQFFTQASQHDRLMAFSQGLPMFTVPHPARLLRQPHLKAEAWDTLQQLQKVL